MEPNANRDEIKAFFDDWELYTTVIERNYMIHQEVLSYVVRRVTELGWSDLSILEVGCGDSHVVSELARFVNVERYCGIELSRIALNFAAEKLAGRVDDLRLINGDMLTELGAIEAKFDLILAGYAIHHLASEEKQRFLSALRERLYPGGLLIVYDLVNEPGESRDAYIERAIDHFENQWEAFSSDQLLKIRNHVTQNDIPESWDSWRKLAAGSGYGKQRFPHYDKNRIFGIMEFLD